MNRPIGPSGQASPAWRILGLWLCLSQLIFVDRRNPLIRKDANSRVLIAPTDVRALLGRALLCSVSACRHPRQHFVIAGTRSFCTLMALGSRGRFVSSHVTSADAARFAWHCLDGRAEPLVQPFVKNFGVPIHSSTNVHGPWHEPSLLPILKCANTHTQDFCHFEARQGSERYRKGIRRRETLVGDSPTWIWAYRTEARRRIQHGIFQK